MAMSHSYQRVVDDENEDKPRDDIRSNVHDNVSNHDPWYRKPSVFWLLPVFLLFSLAMGATSMPRMNIFTSLLCRDILSQSISSNSVPPTRHHGGGMMHMDNTTTMGNLSSSASIIIGEYNPQCTIKEVESATAMLNLWGNLIAGIISAITIPFWGKISDNYGRVKPLAAAASVMLISETIVVLIAKFPDTVVLNWVYLVFVLEGISGSFILIMVLASSYAADCTRKDERNVALGFFHGSMFLGMAVGPAFGGYLGMSTGKSNPLLVFYTALTMRLSAIAFLLVVPESHELNTTDERSTVVKLKQYFQDSFEGTWSERLQRANPLTLLHILSPSKYDHDKSIHRNAVLLVSINTVLFGAMMGGMNIMMLYPEFRFGWDNKQSGIFLSTVNIFRTLATVIILPVMILITRRFFTSSREKSKLYSHVEHSHGFTDRPKTSSLEPVDVFLLRISIISDAIGYIGYALAPNGAIFTISGAIASLGAIGISTSEASVTKLLPAKQTGELLGALGFLQALARIVAPTVAGLTYSWTAERMPQLVFWGIAVWFVAAAGLTWFIKLGEVKEGEGEGNEEMEGDEMEVLYADTVYSKL